MGLSMGGERESNSFFFFFDRTHIDILLEKSISTYILDKSLLNTARSLFNPNYINNKA